MKLISVDFDGTIVWHEYPEIGEPLPEAIEVLMELQEAKDAEGKPRYGLILSTCREDTNRRLYLTEARLFCEKQGVVFRSVNCNLPEDDFRDKGGRKVYAHYYIDDRNLGGFPGWAWVRDLLL